WEGSGEFTRRYGRVEIVRVEKDSGRSRSGSHSCAVQGRKERETSKPGVMPTLFGRHLLGNCVYLTLDEISTALPKMHEFVVPVEMTADQKDEYARISKELSEENKRLVVKGSKRLLGAMLQTLLMWPDYPYEWKNVGYWD